jgi:hypothetical protein
MLGEIQTSAVHMSIRTGKAIRVAVKPNFFITIPVPNNENKKEIVFVVCECKMCICVSSRETRYAFVCMGERRCIVCYYEIYSCRGRRTGQEKGSSTRVGRSLEHRQASSVRQIIT